MIVKGKLNRQQLLALDFFADALLTNQLKRHIIVHVRFRKSMDFLGLTDVEDYNKSGKPREFLLEICRGQSDKEIIHTLAHEMVHVKQYAYGELNEQATYWCGKFFSSNLNYHEQPWEIEAHDVSDLLMLQYTEKYNVKWS